MNEKLSLRDLSLKGKRVLVRVDFNVPLKDGKITDDTRIRASLPTIQYILNHGAIPILMSHLGRPDAKKDDKYTLKPCAERLSQLLNKEVKMAPDCVGKEVESIVKSLKPGDILLLENLRFHKGEEKPSEDPSLVENLAKLGDVYVNDAFGTAHRAHASTALITKYFPHKSASGFLLEKEIEYLGKHLLNPKRPFYAVLGGAKLSTKLKVIESLLNKADLLLIGGAMANTFLKAGGYSIGASLYENDYIAKAEQILKNQSQSKCKILLPVDLVVTAHIDPHAKSRIIAVEEGVPEKDQAVDIGPKTITLFSEQLKKAETVFWNGPLGVFECEPFAKGTRAIAQTLSLLKATTIVGGGDSIAALEQAHLAEKIDHISTGGGATLEYIELGTLPGIEALSNKSERL